MHQSPEHYRSIAAESTFSAYIGVISTTEPTSILMAKPFIVDPPLLNLPSPFPSPDELREALTGGTRRGREIFVRHWLTEGAPAAFRHCPAIYEDLRGWLGHELNVHPKEINLVGSARIGYSLAPPPKFGRAFGEHSDLDFTIVSASLFARMVETFNKFADDYKKGSTLPRSAHEGKLWDSNLGFADRNIRLGFFDGKKIPNFGRYPVAQEINQAMWVLLKKLEATPGAPTSRRASTRVFRDWQCFIDRASLNLRAALTTT